MFALIAGIALLLTVLALFAHHRYRQRHAQPVGSRMRLSEAETRKLAHDVVQRFLRETEAPNA